MSTYQRHTCLHCTGTVGWDAEAEEWACPVCSRRFQPAWIDRQGALTRAGGPVESYRPPVEVLEAAEAASQERAQPSRCLVPGLRPLRQKLGMTQEEFARNLGTTRKRILMWESGEAAPSCAMLIAIVRRCGITFETLTRCVELGTSDAMC